MDIGDGVVVFAQAQTSSYYVNSIKLKRTKLHALEAHRLKLTLTLVFVLRLVRQRRTKRFERHVNLCRQIIENKEIKLTMFSLLKYL